MPGALLVAQFGIARRDEPLQRLGHVPLSGRRGDPSPDVALILRRKLVAQPLGEALGRDQRFVLGDLGQGPYRQFLRRTRPEGARNLQQMLHRRSERVMDALGLGRLAGGQMVQQLLCCGNAPRLRQHPEALPDLGAGVPACLLQLIRQRSATERQFTR